MPGDQPFDFRNSAIQSTSGVFPLPPTVTLPTTITGTPGCFEFRSLSLKSKRRMTTAAPNRRLIGAAVVIRRLLFKLRDRKSTRLNSSHGYISYAVFCLKKKNINDNP